MWDSGMNRGKEHSPPFCISYIKSLLRLKDKDEKLEVEWLSEEDK